MCVGPFLSSKGFNKESVIHTLLQLSLSIRWPCAREKVTTLHFNLISLLVACTYVRMCACGPVYLFD